MRIAIFLQLLWVSGSIFLNLDEQEMVETGDVIPGLLLSMSTIYVLVGIGIFQSIFYILKKRVLFRLVSLLVAVFAVVNILRVFFANPEIGGNASLVSIGAMLNLFGLIAGIAGVFSRISTKLYQPDPISPDFKDSSQ